MRARSRLCRGGVAAIAALLFAMPAVAQESVSLVADRPDFTDGPYTVAPGRFQFEMGYTFSRAGEEEEQDFGELLARLGILSWLEGRLALNSFVLLREPATDDEGLQDLSVGFKARLYRKPPASGWAVPGISILFGADLPTGASGIGTSAVVPGAKLAASWNLTDRTTVASNVGWARPIEDDQRYGQGVASAEVIYQLSDPLAGYVEWYGLFPENRGGGASNFLDAGFGWLLSDNVQLDWRLGVGLQEPNPNWFTGAGLSFRL